MKKRHYSVLLALFFVLFSMAPGAMGETGPAPTAAQTAVDPQEALVQAWARVQEAGSYRFLSTAEQILVPRPIPEMIGKGDVRLTLENDGAVILPNRAYITLRVAGAGQSKSVALLHDGNQSYMLQDGELKPVENALSLASPTNDVLGYLAAAEQVTLMEPPEGFPDLVRYSFVVSGPRFAEYVRQQAEADIRAEPGAPAGLTLQPSPALQKLTGHGELWVNQAGLPVRQVLDIQMPEVNEAYGAQIHTVADLSAYGQVEALPQAVQTADGAWRLEGTLMTGAASESAVLSGVAAQPTGPSQAIANSPVALTTATDRTTQLSRVFPLRVDPSSLFLFIAIVLIILFARYYRHNPRRCYALIVTAVIPIMVFSSLLQASQMLVFMDRQVEAADARAAAMPDMLRALGLQTQAVPSRSMGEAAATYQESAAPDSAIRSTDAITLQEEGGGNALARCGDGEPGVDTDGDGLTDQVELCIGTDAGNPDTDGDGISDRTELEGFDLGGQHWDSDPLSVDSNRDGIMDGDEWSRTLATNGGAANADLDGDGIPNLWDDDDDGDLVPDALDLSPTAVTDYTTEFTLSTSGQMVTGTQAIEFELQPQNLDHLRYSTTVLDWPPDQEGNIQDLNDSTEDLRLLPYLLVTTNIAPDQLLMDQYGVRSWVDDQGQTILLVTMQPLEDGGAIHAFYGKVAYGAGQTGDIQWHAKLVWMAQMQQDRWGLVFEPSCSCWVNRIQTEPQIIHQYQDTFRMTGLHIIKSERYEAMVMGTPGMAWDDRYLFQLFLGLSTTFTDHKTLDGQDEGSGETALDEIAERFASGYEGDTVRTFNIPGETVVVTDPVIYPNAEAGMAGLAGVQLPQFLDPNPNYTGNSCQDAGGNIVPCASLLVATEGHSGVEDLSSLAGADPRIVSLDQLHVDLDSIPLVVARSVNLRMYEHDEVTRTWHPMLPSRMLEIVEARYGGNGGAYETTLNALYPNLRSGEWRFIAYSVYLWAYAGRMVAVSIDGQMLVPEDVDEDALAIQYTVPEITTSTVLAYMGIATGLPSLLSDSYSEFQAGFDIISNIINRAEFLSSSLGKANLAGHLTLAGLGAACSLASLVMGSINTYCASHPDKQGCKNEDALLAANLTIGILTITVQATSIVYNIAEAAIKHLKVTMQNFNVAGTVLGWIGAAIGVTMTWVSFGIIAAHGGSDPISWRVALGMAIMTTIWLVALAIISMIPVVGSIISGILSLIDYIIGLFTGLFANETWSFSRILLELFYDARLCTSLEAAQFGTFHSSLQDPDMGLVGGNKYLLDLPGSGTIVKETEGTDNGTDDDLKSSYVRSSLESLSIENGFVVSDTSQTGDCHIEGGKLECSNTASLGVNLEPAVNGGFSISARMLYATVWAEYTLYAVRVKTHVETGQLPEEDSDPTTVYLDVLPATLSELWNWSELGNPDSDGDGLANDQEVALGTDPDRWDTDGDGLSDRYEIETESARGANVLLADSDGDGLNDALERRAGTRPNVADSDGDGLSDGEELRHLENGVLVGGWQIDPPSDLNVRFALSAGLLEAGEGAYTVSSDPLASDDDADSLNAWEEKANGLSPQAKNALVPTMSLSAEPLGGIPDGRPGMYWMPGTDVSFTVQVANWASEPVTTPLSLSLPTWLDMIDGGVMQGDRNPPMVQNGGSLTWSFTASNTLQMYEVVSATVTARVKPDTTSARNEIYLELLYGDVQLRRSVQAIVDGDDPNVAIMAPVDGAYLRGTSYVVGGSATDSTTWITESSMSIGPQDSEPNYQAVGGTTGLWAYTWSLPADGVYSLYARATDAMQHTTTVGPVNVTVDNTLPEITLAWEMVESAVHLSGTATDNLAGVKWVQLGIDGQPWRNVPFDASSWSYDWTVGESAQGKHEVSVRAIDRSGNESAIITQEITVDRVAPSSIVNAGADHDVPVAVKAGSVFTLTGVADEGGHLPLPAAPVSLRTGLDVLDDSTVWLGLATIHENDGGVLAAWIGDFNADRLSDLVVGLPGPEGSAGSVTILYGRAGGWPVPPDQEMLAHSGTRFAGALGARLGSLVAAAGDVNSDNMDDLLIGERDSTRAFLVFGLPGVLGSDTLDSGQSGYRTMLQAPATIEHLSAAGDVDGDGDGELLIVAGGTAYLIMGHHSPWPETLDVAAEAVATWDAVTGALGVGDVDNDQLAEWAMLANGLITLYGWDTSGVAQAVKTVTTADVEPRATALGDVDGDGYADWLYADGTSRTLMYGGSTSVHSFSDLDGFFAAPGDVDGDGRADILLTSAEGVGTLIRQQADESPEVFATIAGVGGAANAPYASGADLNADGSADLLLIPNQAAAEARGFDAPDFTSGFIAPQALPLGVSTATSAEETSLRMMGAGLLSVGPDTRYVDDDAVAGQCDGHSNCFNTIQEAVDASDGGGDTIVVYPGVYASFRVPAGANYDHLTIKGVSADAVFVEGGTADAIYVAADGVRLSNLTVRNARIGVVLEDGAGGPLVPAGDETAIDHLVAHSVRNPIAMSQSAALTLSDSTLVGNGTDPIVSVSSTLNSAVHTWHTDRTVPQPIGMNGALVTTADKLYALPGGTDRNIYTATVGADGAVSEWVSAFPLAHDMPQSDGKSVLAAGGNYLYQMHPVIATPEFGVFNGEIRAMAVAPNGDVYVGGTFSLIGGSYSANNIARWDGTQWHRLGSSLSNGVNGPVYALTIVSNGEVYVGGHFTRAYYSDERVEPAVAREVPAQNLARWNGSQWQTLGEAVVNENGVYGNGVSDDDGTPTGATVYALAHTSEDVVIVGGAFRHYHAGLNNFLAGEGHCYNFVFYKSVDRAWFHPLGIAIYGTVRNMVWTGGAINVGYLYAGGTFTYAGAFGTAYPKNNVAVYHWNTGSNNHWSALGDGMPGLSVSDVAWDATTGKLYAVSDDDLALASIYWWDGAAWSSVRRHTQPYDVLVRGSSLVADARGNVYAGMMNGDLLVRRAGDLNFDTMAPGVSDGELRIWDLLMDGRGQVLTARGAAASLQGRVRRWTLEGLLRRNLSGTSWESFDYPMGFQHALLPVAVATDDAGNLYASSIFSGDYQLYRFNATSKVWELGGSLGGDYIQTSMIWADGSLYALAYASPAPQQIWYLYRYDAASKTWSQIGEAPLPYGASSANDLSWAWDGGDCIYAKTPSGFYRYRIGDNAWDTLASPSVSFTLSQAPALARVGSHLYLYATPGTGVTTNLFRYGAVGMSDVRLTIERTALVIPDSAGSHSWINRASSSGTYRFGVTYEDSAWVAPSSLTLLPELPTGATRLTSAEAAFVAPADGLYRLSADSALAAGYHAYEAAAHVFTSQAACSACTSGELTWGETAFATVREAVESGAARVLIHPGRYPQTFYLVSGLEVIGSGAENTIITPPAGNAATLVTAEGAAHATLARLTLAGEGNGQGFLAEGGAEGIVVTRSIFRDLDTGLSLRDNSTVEIVNNTIVRNVNGIVISDTTPVNVRNTILAYNTGTGLQYGNSPTSLSNTYNAFWGNATDMDPSDVSLGSLYVDPRFRNLAANDLRLAADSPAIDRGA
ncbi:MAG: right-handed parallel beta-helix repeat-containing protein, partial [Anaerolineae bacterium]